MCYTHHKRPMMALDSFLEVIGNDKKLQTVSHLPPQACFEIAMIYRRTGDFAQASLWFKKASKYDNYITDNLITYRINYVLAIMKAKANDEGRVSNNNK